MRRRSSIGTTEGFQYAYDQLMVLDDGRITYQEHALSEAPPAIQVPDSTSAPPDSEGSTANVWTPPTARQAAAVGAFAALGGLLVYLLPGLKAPFFALFSRIRGEHLLEHPARAQIMVVIEADPGIHFQELMRRLV